MAEWTSMRDLLYALTQLVNLHDVAWDNVVSALGPADPEAVYHWQAADACFTLLQLERSRRIWHVR